MTYTDLKKIFAPPAKDLRLSDSTFPNSGLARLLSHFFEGNELNLTKVVARPDDKNKEVSLSGQLTNAFLGIAALKNQIKLSAVFSIFNEEPIATIHLTFNNDWKLSEALSEEKLLNIQNKISNRISSQFTVPITEIELDSGLMSMTIHSAPNLPLRFADIPQLLQGVGIADQFPDASSGFPAFDQELSITAFKISTRIDPIILVYLSLEVQVLNEQNGWRPIGDLIYFKDLRANFLCMNPLGGATISAEIRTIATIANKDIVGIISLPDMSFQCYLRQGETIDIKALLESIVDVPIPMPSITCTELGVIGTPAADTYEFYATIEDLWEFEVAGTKIKLEELSCNFTLITGAERQTGGGFDGSIAFGSTQFLVSAQHEPGALGWQFSGGLAKGARISIETLMTNLSNSFGTIDLPGVLAGLKITEIYLSFNTATKEFHFACQTQLKIEDVEADLLLNIDITPSNQGFNKFFGGILSIVKEGSDGSRSVREFNISFSSTAESNILQAGFENEEGERFDPVGELLSVISKNTELKLIGAADSSSDSVSLKLTTLKLYLLQLKYEKTKTATPTTSYSFSGEFDWEPSIPIGLDEPLSLLVRASIKDLKIEKSGASKKVSGTISGTIATKIPHFEALVLRLVYKFGSGATVLSFELQIKDLVFSADYSKSTAGDIELKFGVRTDKKPISLTLGDMITFVVSLVDPSIDEFEFDPPWDFLTGFNVGSLLENTTIIASLPKGKDRTFSIKFENLASLVPSSLSSIVSISGVELKYEAGVGKKKVQIILGGTVLGKPIPAWDPLNEAPPAIPGKGVAMFDLRYLGLGQRVSVAGIETLTNIKAISDALKSAITENADALAEDPSKKGLNPLALGGVVFNPASEMLIGAEMSLLKTLDLYLIFNDPVVYGLRLELSGDLAKNFAGLQFEILYRRISDTIGVYHTDLTLPDAVRNLQFGAVSITLPILVLDIYTNGDFKVDLGFPWNNNFARSFAIEVLPFTGAGGFYFNKLSAATATSTPTVKGGVQQGIFDPVYEFGLGLRLGLGKSFNKGPLSAEISITVQGIIQGVISWYNPTRGDRELYYALRGSVSIIGRLYGKVDFEVIKIEVEVIARATIQFVIEVYRPIHIRLIAEVSVKASVTVLFITVNFSFSLTIEQQFTIPSPTGDVAPWEIAPAAKVAAQIIGEERSVHQLASLRSVEPIPSWALDKKLWDTPKPIDVFFQPGLSWNTQGVLGEALLFIENTNKEGGRDFGELIKGLLEWTWKVIGMDATNISKDKLTNAYKLFVGEAQLKEERLEISSLNKFTYAELETFLSGHYQFKIQLAPDSATKEMAGTIFPMFPGLSINGILPNEIKAKSIAELIFVDYARLLIRCGMQVCIDHLEKPAATTISTIDALFTAMGSMLFESVATMASRFMLHGLRMENGIPLYEATKQQFELEKASTKDGHAYEIKLEDPIPIPAESTENVKKPFILFSNTDPKIRSITYSIVKGTAANSTEHPLHALAVSLGNITPSTHNLPSESVQQIPFYQKSNLHFAMRKWASLESNDPYTHLLELPKSLTDHLKTTSQAQISLLSEAITAEGKPQDQQSIALDQYSWATRLNISLRQIPGPNGEGLLPNTFLLNGMNEAEKDVLEAVWKFLNGTPSTDLVEIIMLYPEEAGKVDSKLKKLPGTAEQFVLIKTNLSNNSDADANTETEFSASLKNVGAGSAVSDNEELQFLKLLWEGSIVNSGGYYLHLAAITDTIAKTIFSKGVEGSIQLVIRFTDLKNPVSNFHNCMLLKQNVLFTKDSKDVSKEIEHLILAKSNTEVAALRVPAGHIGFKQASRPVPVIDVPPVIDLKLDVSLKAAPTASAADVETLSTGTKIEGLDFSKDRQWVFARVPSRKTGWIPLQKTTQTTTAEGKTTTHTETVLDASTIQNTLGQQELNNLYQLMGYQVVANSHFKASNRGLPIGPTSPIEGQWLYERIIPAFDLAASADASDLRIQIQNEDKPKNPYLGVGTNAEIVVETWWQDIYGNAMLSAKASSSFKVRYTDPLIGLNQWPSVAEQYEFTKIDDKNCRLSIEFAFDVTAYTPTQVGTPSIAEKQALLDKTNSSLEIYRKVYFQLSQQDISFEIKTTLVDNWSVTNNSATALVKDLVQFVLDIYLYLEGQKKLLLADTKTINTENTDAEKIPPQFIKIFDIPFKTGALFHFPKSFIFGLTVQFDIKRDVALIHPDLKTPNGAVKPEHEEVEHALAYLSPNPSPNPETRKETKKFLSLKRFAENFEEAFPGLRLAISQERLKNNTNGPDSGPNLEGRPLYVVQLGEQGIKYTIKKDTSVLGDEPAFFAIPPLSNALHSINVEPNDYTSWKNTQSNPGNNLVFNTKGSNKHFKGVDLNILGREFLVALENFLRPEMVIPARAISNEKVNSIIKNKGALAKAISDKVAPILARDNNKSKQLLEAKKTLQQQLLINLVEGFDIETVVSYQVDVKIGSHLTGKIDFTSGLEPRIVGKPVVKSVNKKVEKSGDLQPDFSISSTKIPLKTSGEAFFNYLFDTRTPEKFENIELELEFKMTDIEYQIEKVEGIGNYEASSWLNFILPNKIDAMGTSAVPIPLRSYPMPPSIIRQEALLDKDSQKQLEKIRQWSYSIIYEHIDIAQDVIDCIVELNQMDSELASSDSLGEGERNLLSALVNFFENYPQIERDLQLLNTSKDGNNQTITFALVALDKLVGDVSTAWKDWNNEATLHATKGEDLHFEIQETGTGLEKTVIVKTRKQIQVPDGADLPDPTIELPGYELISADSKPLIKTLNFAIDASQDAIETFGDSSIPDRKLIIHNLDIIHHQNAWAGIWMSRNKELVDGQTTNPLFVFQTPLVQFKNMLTPFLINDIVWDINSLNKTGSPVSLEVHLKNLFSTILPASTSNAYQLRISCRYAFAMVKGKNLSENLWTEFPILLGQPIEESATNDLPHKYPEELAEQIKKWQQQKQPSTDDAFFVFTFSIFSRLTNGTLPISNLPLLKIERLFLQLKDVSG